MARTLQQISGASARRPLLTLSVVVLLALAGGALALRLRPSAATDTFVSASSPAYRATSAEQRRFGADAIVVLVHAPLTALLAPADLARLTRLEACLGGQSLVYDATLRANVPAAGRTAYGGAHGPCATLMRTHAVQVVYGPGTFLNRAVAAVNGGIRTSLTAARAAGNRAAAAAERLARARGQSPAAARADAAAAREAEVLRVLGQLEHLAAGTGLSGVPSIADEPFLRQIVFGAARGASTPRPRFAYLFPDSDSALIQVRLRADLSGAEQSRALAAIRAAVHLPMFAPPDGGSVIVTGVPVVLHDLSGAITGAIGELLAVALLLMAAALLTVFRRRPPLLPLAVALAATGITFGLLSLAGATLTLASVAVLPVLIGLAVDYGVQFQSRASEVADRVPGGDPIAEASGRAAPSILAAALATAVGFAALWLSPVPMVRGFGLLLIVGVAVAAACTLTAIPAALALAGRPRTGRFAASARGAREILAGPWRGAREILAGPWRGAREILAGPGRGLAAAGRGAREILRVPTDPARALHALTRHPARVLAVGLVLAVAGWIADGATPVQSDVTKLVPQSMVALTHLRTLEATTGVSGEIDVAVTGADVATPATLRWMTDYQGALLRHFGYASNGSCAHATLCPALSLPDLFTAAGTSRAALTQSEIDGLLREVPAYFSSAVLTPDHRAATLAFGIRLMPLARQQRVIQYMRAHLHPPSGVRASLTGLPVLAAQAEASLASPGRRLLTVLVGLVAVALALLVVLRRPRRALVPMIPIVLATGWSSLVLYALSIPLNPMSATLGALVIAISTEFSVLLAERHRQELAAGRSSADALVETYRRTGRAVLTSGATAIVGFGVLVISDITMLRDFGLVTLVDLTVSLLGVLVVLPAALALAADRGPDAAPARQRRRPVGQPAGVA